MQDHLHLHRYPKCVKRFNDFIDECPRMKNTEQGDSEQFEVVISDCVNRKARRVLNPTRQPNTLDSAALQKVKNLRF